MTDGRAEQATAALAYAADAEYEGEHGVSFVALNALMMQRYMHEYGYRHEDFGGFADERPSQRDHQSRTPCIRRPSPRSSSSRRAMIASPISLLDSSGIGDGAAAVVLVPADLAARLRLSRWSQSLASAVGHRLGGPA